MRYFQNLPRFWFIAWSWRSSGITSLIKMQLKLIAHVILCMFAHVRSSSSTMKMFWSAGPVCVMTKREMIIWPRWTTRFTDSLSSRPWLRDQVWTKVWIRLKYQGLKHVGSFLTISRILRNLDLWTQPCQASTATSTLYSLLACSVLSHSECFGTPTPRAFSSCKAHRGDILARLTSIPQERFCTGQRTESCNGGFHQKLE